MEDLGLTYSNNLGDYIQSIILEDYYKLNITKRVNVFQLRFFKGSDRYRLYVNAYLSDKPYLVFPFSDYIEPVFIGLHLTNLAMEYIKDNTAVIEWFRKYHVGCRDKDTMFFLKNLGVDAYYNGCITLKLEKRNQEISKNEEVIFNEIPGHLFLGYKYNITTNLVFGYRENIWKDARDLLEKYKKSKLVVTTRLHTALPCIALGVPLIFLSEYPYDHRLGILNDYNVKIHSIKDIEEIKLQLNEYINCIN